MWLLARARWYLASRFLADQERPEGINSNQNTARSNAAEASATLQERRRDRDDVEAYLHAWRLSQPSRTQATESGEPGSEHAL